jgi:hypothetical protein
MDLILTKGTGASPIPLELSVEGSCVCFEGETLRIETRTQTAVMATIEGFPLPNSSIRQVGADILMQWSLLIDSWAGETRIELQAGDIQQSITVDVQPHPGKLGREAFNEMLAELSDISKDLPWGASPGHMTAELDKDSPLVVQPVVLEHLLPDLVKSVRQVRREPLIRSERVQETRPLSFATRMSPKTLRQLIARPTFIAALDPAHDSDSEGIARIRIEQPVPVTAYDHPATRYLVGLLRRLQRSLNDTRRELEKIAAGGGPGAQDHFVKAYADSLLAPIHRCQTEVASFLDTGLFRNMKPAPLTESAAQAILDHPAYNRLLRILRQLLTPGLHLSEHAAMKAGIRRTWDLFELLCLFRLGRQLAEALGEEWSWKREAPILASGFTQTPKNDLSFLARHADGYRLELHYQRTFSSAKSEKDLSGFRSLTGERRPDYILGLFKNNELIGWIVLDAKYRSTRGPVLDGLADVHVYRDSLRWQGQRCDAGFILVPTLNIGTRRYGTVEYRDTFAIGALVLQDNAEGLSAVAQWLKESLGK